METERRPRKCSAITAKGTQCGLWATPGYETCRHHGEHLKVYEDERRAYRLAEKRAVEDFQMSMDIGKRYQLGTRLGEIRARQATDAQNILDATEEIELLTARIQLLLDESEEMPQLTKKVYAAFSAWREAKASRNPARFAEMSARLEHALEACEHGHIANEELYTALDHLRKFKAEETKRRIAMRQMMDAGDSDKFFKVFQDAVLEATTVISDHGELMEFKRILVTRIHAAFAPTPKPIPQ